MANVVRVRVEQKQWNDDSMTAFKKMFTAFKRAYNESGVAHSYKEHESYESKGRKVRRKQREAEIQRLRSKIKENFIEKPKN